MRRPRKPLRAHVFTTNPRPGSQYQTQLGRQIVTVVYLGGSSPAAEPRATLASRGPGRPPGARNRRTDEAARIYMSEFGDPLRRGVAISALPILAPDVLEGLAKRLDCSKIEAAKRWAGMSRSARPAKLSRSRPPSRTIPNIFAGQRCSGDPHCDFAINRKVKTPTAAQIFSLLCVQFGVDSGPSPRRIGAAGLRREPPSAAMRTTSEARPGGVNRPVNAPRSGTSSTLCLLTVEQAAAPHHQSNITAFKATTGAVQAQSG